MKTPQTLGSWAVTILGLFIAALVFRLGWEAGAVVWGLIP